MHRIRIAAITAWLCILGSVCHAQESASDADAHQSVSLSPSTAPGDLLGDASLDTVWAMAESPNFRIRAPRSSHPQKLARRCEQWRSEMTERWLGSAVPGRWTPRCEIVIHSSADSYLAAVGRQGRFTSGCASIETSRGRVVARRVDLRGADRDTIGSTLPHELTHVVLADLPTAGPLPRWIDEGLAVLADSPAKRRSHELEFQQAIDNRSDFRLGELFQLDDYPRAERRSAFYGQSASVVEFLVSQGTPQQFSDFAALSSRTGYDAALRRVYGIRDVGQLERLWRENGLETVR